MISQKIIDRLVDDYRCFDLDYVKWVIKSEGYHKKCRCTVQDIVDLVLEEIKQI